MAVPLLLGVPSLLVAEVLSKTNSIPWVDLSLQPMPSTLALNSAVEFDSLLLCY